MTAPLPWYLGPAGALQEIKPPVPGVRADEDQSAVESELLNGGAHVQQKGATTRRYAWTWDIISAAELSVLTALKVGAFGPGPFRLIDPHLRNRLRADASAVVGDLLALFTYTTGSLSSGTPRYGTQAVRWSITTGTASGARLAALGGLDAVPCVSGQQITASVYVTGTNVSVAAGIVWYDVDGILISTSLGAGSALTGSYVRRTASGTPPAGAAYAAVAVVTTTTASGAAVVTADQLQLEEGTSATTWQTGHSQPRLAFLKLSPGYPAAHLLSADAELVEVV